jgi:hypothetical protein
MEAPASADLIYKDDKHCVVVCPHCMQLHKLQKTKMKGVNTCAVKEKEYTVGEFIGGENVYRALKRRKYELEIKRVKYNKKPAVETPTATTATPEV